MHEDEELGVVLDAVSRLLVGVARTRCPRVVAR